RAAHSSFEATAAICEMTNFWLASATVTTSTMEALPIITPSDVRIARSLFARSASIATDIVSRISIVAFGPEFSRSHGQNQFLALPQPLQLFLSHFVFWIQFQHAFKFLRGLFHLVLIFKKPSQPGVGRGRPRIS